MTKMGATIVTSRIVRHLGTILFLAIVLTFSGVLACGFITLDDGSYVFTNPLVLGGLTPTGIVAAFSREVAGNWHPVTVISHMAIREWFGFRPWAHHLVNLLLHSANCLLLFDLLRNCLARANRLGGRAENGIDAECLPHQTIACALAAAFFALHPLRVESVAWISELKDLLCALFFLLAIRAYLAWTEAPTWSRYLPVMGFLGLGLMSKPMIVTLPCVFLLLDFWPLARFGKGGGEAFALPRFRRLCLEKIPLLALCVGSCIVTVAYQKAGQAVQSLELYPFTLRLQSAVVAYAAYLGKIVWPLNLAVFYPYPRAWPSLVIIAASLLIAGLSAAAILLRKRAPALAVGWFWYLGTLVPVIGIVQVGQQAMADRYTYIPAMGLALVTAWAGAIAFARPIGKWLLLGASAVLLALAVLTWQQVSVWRSSEPLYRHALKVTQENWFIHRSLGMWLAYARRLDEGIGHLEESVRIDPRNPGSWGDLATLLQMRGNQDEAARAFETVIRLEPKLASAHQGLAEALRAKGDIAGAVTHLREAIRLAPTDPGPLIDLARIRASHSDPRARNASEAIALATKACELTNFRDADALDALGAACAEGDQFDRALDFAQQAAQAAESSGRKNLTDEIRARALRYERRLPARSAP